MSDRLFLGLDNSMGFLNLVLGTEDGLIEERHSQEERHSSEVLPVRVSRLLEDHGAAVGDLSALIVTLGPGSFTGVRVALAFCKGLVAGLAIPLFGIPTPDVLALPFDFMEGYYLCPLIDAKKGEVFFALYRVLNGAVHTRERNSRLETRQDQGVDPRPLPLFRHGGRSLQINA